ncbi:hypothetical protein GCM10028790_39550 [Micromonospora taraxaci]|nr:hypothetical protein [Micromonospora taraxaci]
MGRPGLAATCGINAVGESATDGVEADGTARLGVPEGGLVGTPPDAAEPVEVGPGIPLVAAGDTGPLAAAPGDAGRAGAAPGDAGPLAAGETGGLAAGDTGRLAAAPGVAGRLAAALGVAGPVGAGPDQEEGRVGVLPGTAGRSGPWLVGLTCRPGVAAEGRPDPACGPDP